MYTFTNDSTLNSAVNNAFFEPERSILAKLEEVSYAPQNGELVRTVNAVYRADDYLQSIEIERSVQTESAIVGTASSKKYIIKLIDRQGEFSFTGKRLKPYLGINYEQNEYYAPFPEANVYEADYDAVKKVWTIDIDYQAGAESAITLMSGILTDVDLAYFAAGMLSGFNVTSLEKYIVDEQLIKMLKRLYSGIAIDKTKDYTLEINKVGPRGNFLQGRTPKEYKQEHFVPDIFIKVDYNTWQTEDGLSVKEKASQAVKNRIESYVSPELTPEQNKIIESYL